MTSEPSDEVLFTVVGDHATLATTVRIEDLGLTEPRHLEKWVIQYPQTLGSDVLVLASQYDRWQALNGTDPRDRLDVLGLDNEGRLVIVELKRGRAPDTVDMQAVKYAAMAAGFTLEDLASLHAEFLSRTQGEKLTTDEAAEKLQAHTPDVDLSEQPLRSPRILLLAEGFTDVVTTSVVWLADQGVNISLRRYQAYQTAGGETIVTVSQVFPFADLRAVSPLPLSAKVPKAENLPEVPWRAADFAELLRLAFPVPIAILNSCAEQPGTWVSSLTAYERAGVEVASGTGQLAGFGFSVRARFKRRNHPWETKWGAAGSNSNAYRITEETAAVWHDALREAGEEPSPEG